MFSLCKANLSDPPTASEMDDLRSKKLVELGRHTNKVAGHNLNEAPDESFAGSLPDYSGEEVNTPYYCMLRKTIFKFKKVDFNNNITEKNLQTSPAHYQ